MVMVANPKAAWATGVIPEANMWWAQTPNPRNAIAAPAKTTAE